MAMNPEMDAMYAPTGGVEPPGRNLLEQLLRQFLCVGTAGVVAVGALTPEQVGTNSLALVVPAIEGGAQFRNRSTTVALSVVEQLRELLAALALNKSLLAEVLRVSRPTLYDWFDSKEPNAANALRLATLLRLVSRAGVSGNRPLNARFVRQSILEGTPPLLAVLESDYLDEERVVEMLREARRLTDQTEENSRAREQSMRTIGYEALTDEQHRQILAQNITLRDWPKT